MKTRLISLLCVLLCISEIALAQPASPDGQPPAAGAAPETAEGSARPDFARPDRPVFDVFGLIARLADEMDREFIVDPRVSPGMFGWSTAGDEADYDTLLALLRGTGFAAVEVGEQIRIVPEGQARGEPTRILQEDDRRVSDHAIVTRVIDVTDIPILSGSSADEIGSIAPQLVPALRPMMSTQAAQFTSIPGTNKLIIVDRYDNVRRITAVIDALRR